MPRKRTGTVSVFLNTSEIKVSLSGPKLLSYLQNYISKHNLTKSYGVAATANTNVGHKNYRSFSKHTSYKQLSE